MTDFESSNNRIKRFDCLITFMLSAEQRMALKAYCGANQANQSQVIREALARFLNNWQKEHKQQA